MPKRASIITFIVVIGVMLFNLTAAEAAQRRLDSKQSRQERRMESLKEEVRHQLVTQPYYSVFDWLEAEVQPDGAVTLRGQVTQPTTKGDAESRIKRLEGATRVVSNIEVLPLSPSDDALRRAIYLAIYRDDTPLFKYALQSVGPIHIVVKNGRVVLKGVVASQMDSQLAYTAAREVPGALDVQNELRVENAVTMNVPNGGRL